MIIINKFTMESNNNKWVQKIVLSDILNISLILSIHSLTFSKDSLSITEKIIINPSENFIEFFVIFLYLYAPAISNILDLYFSPSNTASSI